MVRPTVPDPALRRRLEQVTGPVVDWRTVEGGFSAAGLWVVETVPGESFFVKAAVDSLTAGWIHDESRIYLGVEASFLPRLVHFDPDPDRPFLVLEDLSGAHWPPPWQPGQVDLVLAMHAELRSLAPPPTLPGAGVGPPLDGWQLLAPDPTPLVRLGVDRKWLKTALPALLGAERRIDLSGDSIVHGDIRSDNLCFDPAPRLVDWNWASVGDPQLDLVAWLPSLHVEGGPAPWDILDDPPVPLVAGVAGFFLERTTRPLPERVRAGLRDFQRAQGEVALAWAAMLLGLDPPPAGG